MKLIKPEPDFLNKKRIRIEKKIDYYYYYYNYLILCRNAKLEFPCALFTYLFLDLISALPFHLTSLCVCHVYLLAC